MKQKLLFESLDEKKSALNLSESMFLESNKSRTSYVRRTNLFSQACLDTTTLP